MTNDSKPVSPTLPLIIAALWLAVAVLAAGSGRLGALHPPVPQLILAALTVALLVLVFQVAPVRDWVASLTLPSIVALHLTRAIAGSAFLVYYGRGELPGSFALPAGWGDIAVAALALVILLGPSADTPAGRRRYSLWNLLGLIDILLVVLNAARTAMADPASMAALLRLPLSLLPTFLVPIVIVSHIVILRRLRGK